MKETLIFFKLQVLLDWRRICQEKWTMNEMLIFFFPNVSLGIQHNVISILKSFPVKVLWLNESDARAQSWVLQKVL